MKNKTLDEVDIKCPRCQKTYQGKNVNNPYESQGVCDWCALSIMISDNPAKPSLSKPSVVN